MIKKFFSFIVIVSFLFLGVLSSLKAEEENTELINKETEPALDLDKELDELYKDEMNLKKWEYELKTATQTYLKNKDKIANIEEELTPLQDKKATLETQLELFDEQINLISTKVQNVQIQINQKRLEIAKLQETIERAEIEIKEEETLILNFIKQIYLEEQKYTDNDSENSELIKLLLSEQSISKSLQEIEFLKVMEKLGRDIFYHLETAKTTFISKKEELELKKNDLNKLKLTFEKEKLNLLTQKEGREKLLAETKGKESEYQKMLAESKKQSEDSLLIIAALSENQSQIKSKLSVFSDNQSNLSTELLSNVIKQSDDDNKYNLDNLIADSVLNSRFMWPVTPEKSLSAYYLDPSYKEYFGVEHYAVDIRIEQGSAIFAPASAYVQKVVDNGMGYSYIVLAHKDNFSTLYGHVSQINVKEGDLVQIGTIIGKTGGTPGTKGAGLMTTGPHLHFEVHLDGKNVDPLNYLPLKMLPK